MKTETLMNKIATARIAELEKEIIKLKSLVPKHSSIADKKAANKKAVVGQLSIKKIDPDYPIDI